MYFTGRSVFGILAVVGGLIAPHHGPDRVYPWASSPWPPQTLWTRDKRAKTAKSG